MTDEIKDIQQGLPGCEHRGGQKLTVLGLAEIFGVTDRCVQIWATEGIIQKDQRGVYDLIECVKAVYQHQRKMIERGGSTESLEDLRKEGQRINNETATLELEKLKGNLISAADVQREALAEGKRVKEFLDNLIIRTQYELAAETDPRSIAETLRKEHAKIGLPEDDGQSEDEKIEA